MDAVIHIHFGVDPETLDYGEYLRLYAEWQFTEKIKHENLKATILNCAAEILKAINENVGNENNMDPCSSR